MSNKRASRAGVLFVVVALFADYGFAQLVMQESKWDRALPSMVLTYVAVEENSLTEAWQEMTWKYSLRSILFFGKSAKHNSSSPSKPFSFSATETDAGSLLDAFGKNYGYDWTQDEATGVIWLYPDDHEYKNILSEKISTKKDMLAVPLQTGVLLPLSKSGELGYLPAPMNPISLATYNYNMNIPSGTYTVRELLNIASVAKPSSTFIVSEDLYGNGIDEIMQLNVLSDTYPILTPGAVLFWETELGAPNKLVPVFEVLREKLSAEDSSTRKKARQFTLLTTRTGTLGDVIKSAAHPSEDREQDLWVATYFLYFYLNDDYRRTPKEIRQLLEGSLTEEFVRTGSPQIVLLAGLARLAEAGGWNLTTPVKGYMSARHFAAQELQGIEEDVAHIALRSESVFRMLTDRSYSGYIDTSGWAEEFLGDSFEEAKTLQYTVVVEQE